VTADDPVPLGDALDAVVRSLRGGAGRAEVRGVFGQWEEAVGEAIAAHVRPVRLERGTLLVEVDDPSWATQVRVLGDDLRTRLLTVADVAVERIEVRVVRRP
jgi:predicted nucleic acid-binding Zn ribbon protein